MSEGPRPSEEGCGFILGGKKPVVMVKRFWPIGVRSHSATPPIEKRSRMGDLEGPHLGRQRRLADAPRQAGSGETAL